MELIGIFGAFTTLLFVFYFILSLLLPIFVMVIMWRLRDIRDTLIEIKRR